MSESFDVVVVGGGPGGYVAAIRAAQLGLKTAVIEKEHLGGICLNWGCIPTKALLKSSEVYHTLQNLESYGFAADNIRFDLEKVVARSRNVSSKLTQGIQHLLKKNKVKVIDGFATLAGNGKLSVDNNGAKSNVEADHIILATGARAREIPSLKPDGKHIWTYREAMVPDMMPKSLLVVGSGAIGMEFASFYNDMGADVTVVEVVDRVLPVEDEEISKIAERAFKKQGIKIKTSTTVTATTVKGGQVEVTFEGKGKSETVVVDRVISAVGITGNIENIGLEAVGVKTDRGHIEVNEWCETSVARVYAIGDVAGPPWLAHKASHEGVMVAEKIAEVADLEPMNMDNIPGCTYCRPQVASVGLTEQQAKDKGIDVRVGRFNLMASGKAIAIGENEGLVKTVFDKQTGELLGAHMIGPEVTEQIQGFGIARTLEATEHELMHTVFAHPTLSEAMHESVLDAFGKAIHQ